MEAAMQRTDLKLASPVALALCLAGCGGGGSDSAGLKSTPIPQLPLVATL